MIEIYNYIGGELKQPTSGSFFPSINPATNKEIAQVPNSDAMDVEEAVQAAKDAFEGWKNTDVNERSRILVRIADLIEKNLDSLAQDESMDNGKPLWLAKAVDIPRASSNFRFFAHAITQFHSEAYDMGTLGFNYTLRHPLGVCGLISPWNLPLYLFSWKIAPAIASGNTAVAKPSEITPLTAFRLSEICIQAGLPPGVLNIVHGKGQTTGEPIVTHPDVKAISFTGSTGVGKRINQLVAGDFKKVSLEMGGKNPNIIFADADLKEAIPGTLKSSFANQGQICLCGSRILVERPIYDQFVQEFVAGTKKIKVGDPSDPRTKMGAIVSKDQYEKNLSYIQIAKDEGGEILCGGKRAENLPSHCKDGYFLEPTIIGNLGPECRTNQEEIFGPIVTIYPFDNEEEALSYANSTKYGLAATVWTNDLKRAHRVARNLESGIVWINSWLVRDLRTPFGGMKQSGIGREGGVDALRFFTEPKNIFVGY